MSLNNSLNKWFRRGSKLQKNIADEVDKTLEFIEYEESRAYRFMRKLIFSVLAPLVRSVWIKKVEGYENLPKEGPAVVALNHSSYFDFLCFSALSKRPIHFLAAEKFFESRLWKPLMRLTGQIRVDRHHPDKTKVYAQVFAALKQGRLIGIFPEGTRSPDDQLLKAFNGVAKIALKAKVPIIPVGIEGTYHIMSRHDKLPKLKKKAKFKIGEPLHFQRLHDIEHSEEHFQQVTDIVMLRIASLCNKSYPHANATLVSEEVVIQENTHD